MRINIILLFCLFIMPTYGQESFKIDISNKFGKPNDSEVSMSSYQPDSTANAVVLSEKTLIYYDYVSAKLKQSIEFRKKIKILKTEGTSYANITIPYRETLYEKEFINQIEAYAYNLEDGKVVRTKMMNNLIFRENLENSTNLLKFSIPNVKVGTVIEYKYKIESDYYYIIPDWIAQESIPVYSTRLDLTIPEYFKFNIEMKGSNKLNVSDKPENVSFNFGNQILQNVGRRLIITGDTLPALKSDKYIWCKNDYASQVNFDLSRIEIPGSLYKTYTQTWEHIDKLLFDDDNFGGLLKKGNPYSKEFEDLKIANIQKLEDKVATIFTFLKSKIAWNNKYAFTGDIKKAVKEGNGNNAAINFILISMLRDANIKSYPAIMSSKDNGILPLTHPSLDKLNTFVVAIEDSDSTYLYIDGSIKDGYINTLPLNLLVNKARVLKKEGSSWVDLSELGNNRLMCMTVAKIDDEGTIAGKTSAKYMGHFASSMKHTYREVKDSTDFTNKLSDLYGVTINQSKFDGLNNFTPNIKGTFSFTKQTSINDNYIYFNPLIITHVDKNPFEQSERKLPIEYDYKKNITLSASIEIPKSYAIEELPKSVLIKTSDGQNVCQYIIEQHDNTIMIKYAFKFNKLFYLNTEYLELRNFWKSVVDKNNETIVLKKI